MMHDMMIAPREMVPRSLVDNDDGDDGGDDDDVDAAGKQKIIGRVEYPSLFVVAVYISISCSSNSNRSTRRGLILSVCTS